jgi:endonuclease/exonuclease/phosphatase (EEP) superfamily protein YafD
VAKAGVALAFLAICAWWALLILGPERFWLSGAYLYVPYWMVLLPLIVVAGIAWPLGWRWRAAVFATLMIYIWPIMGFNVGQADNGFGRIRLMTYNIKSYLIAGEVGGFDGVISEIRQHDPDIVVMQDASSMLNWARQDNPQIVREVVGSRFVYSFGQYVVASKFPLRGCDVGSIAYNEQSHTFVHCIVTAHGQSVDLYTAHFVSPRDGLNAMRWGGIKGYEEWQGNVQDRMVQAEKLARTLTNRRLPAIVAGDLNAPEQSLVVRTLLDAGLRDAFSSAGRGYGYTHGHSLRPHLFSTTRIDHILVSQEIGVADSFVGGKEGSEHRPVIADLWLY